jgi:Domain of unknown function (DUF4160)
VPTVLRIGGYRFYFYSHEPNEPPHVHVDRAEASAKVWLNEVAVARRGGFRAKELNGILGYVQEHRVMLLEAWHEYFSDDR